MAGYKDTAGQAPASGTENSLPSGSGNGGQGSSEGSDGTPSGDQA